jgi:hypothetical protein
MEPTLEQRVEVAVHAAGGVPHRAIAFKVGIALDTLKKHFPDQLAFGRESVLADMVGRLYKIAMGSEGASVKESLRAIMFYLNTREGWRRGVVLENPDGSGLFEKALDKLSSEELRTFHALMEKTSVATTTEGESVH